MSALPQGLLLLLPICFCAGIDLYLTLTLLGLALWQGGLVTELVLPDALGGTLVLGCTASLYLLETLAQRRPLPALVWHNVQLLNRPLAGGLMGVLLLRGEGPLLVLAAAGLGGVVAAFAHVLTWGQGLLLRLLPDPRRSMRLDLTADLMVAVSVVLTLLVPEISFAAAVLCLALALVFGHHLHAAARFGFVLLRGLLWGILSSLDWANRDELPPWVRSATGEEAFEGIRGMRAGRKDLGRSRHFEEGWLVERGNGLFFAFRRHRRSVVVDLSGTHWDPASVSPIARTHVVRHPGETPAALFLQRSAPAPESHKWR